MAQKHLSRIFCGELEGVNARLIEVEVDINVGLSSFTIVGLADKAVSEARERVSSALKNSGIKPPTRENRRVTVNLAPADVKKNGSQYDLAIAMGYLRASGQIKSFDSGKMLFLGELALDGSIRPVPGVLNICHMAREYGMEEVFIPYQNSKEASLMDGIRIIPVRNFSQLVKHLEQHTPLLPLARRAFESEMMGGGVDISEIKGQQAAKRSLSVAAAGGHNIFMTGPPGTGKTMLAKALVSILPDFTFQEAVETTRIYSAAGLLAGKPFISYRPFCAPHHSSSLVSLVGGGQHPRPGQISLAHRGVLFLDEIPEFHRDVLEALRQPLENGDVVVARSKKTLTFPARFMLVAASNPCPCGFWQDGEKECTCSAHTIARYQKKLSGPLLDRIDLQIWVRRLTSDAFSKKADPAESLRIKKQVNDARARQFKRFDQYGYDAICNSELSSKQVEESVDMSDKAKEFLNTILDKGLVSARGYFKIAKVAQTIADMNGGDVVGEDDVQEAFSYRMRTQD